MPSSVCRIIPADPHFVPRVGAREKAAAYVRRLMATAEHVAWRVTPDVQFVDCGENFESVHCPTCGADLGEWWAIAMEAGHEQQFRDLRITTPCCRGGMTLNELDYSWPSGFARAVLEVYEPGVGSIAAQSIERLETLLGCPLRVIWAHY